MARFLRADDLFMAMCFLVGPMAVLAPNGLAVILVVSSVGLVLLEPVRLRLAHVARWPIYVLGLFAALAAASLAWTIDAGEGLDGWIRICSTALLGLVWIDKAIALDGSARTRADRALVYGMLASLARGGADSAALRSRPRRCVCPCGRGHGFSVQQQSRRASDLRCVRDFRRIPAFAQSCASDSRGHARGDRASHAVCRNAAGLRRNR